MENPVERMRAAVASVANLLDENSFVLLPTSRGLEVIVDKKFEMPVKNHRWYAALSRGGHIHAVADVEGRRVSLQRYILTLANPLLTLDGVKQVSFVNKISLDCRMVNLENRVGRQAVMRNRRPKRNTTSRYKGVARAVMANGEAKWKAQIKGDVDHVFLGYFEDEEKAAMVYDAAAYLLFDGAALYNLPERCPNFDALEAAASKIARFRARKKARTDA